jgi:hypothetical protein
LSLCLTIASGGGLIYLLVFAAGWKGWMVMGAGFLFAIGVVWLWSDFIDATPNEDDLGNAKRPPR